MLIAIKLLTWVIQVVPKEKDGIKLLKHIGESFNDQLKTNP